jgi:hypothetical protein
MNGGEHMLIESLLERFSFDNCGRRLKGIIKAVFWINTILVAVGWAILSLTMIFNEPEVGFLVLLLGWIPAVFEILFFYIALLPMGAFAELVENSHTLVEQGYILRKAKKEEKAAPPVPAPAPVLKPEPKPEPNPEPKPDPKPEPKPVFKPTPRPIIPNDGQPRCPTCGRLRKEGLSWCVGCGNRLPPEEKKP